MNPADVSMDSELPVAHSDPAYRPAEHVPMKASQAIQETVGRSTPRVTLVEATRVPVTVVIPTLNEAPRLRATLSELCWADEVIVVDGGSTDGTATIARSTGARVLTVPGPTIGAQRNAGSAAARNQWVLALDADEQVTPELRESLARLSSSPRPGHVAYRVRSRNWHLGQEMRHGPWAHDWKVRVFTRDQRFTNDRVHERLADVETVGALDGTLLHHPYRDLAHQIDKIVKYAQWAAADLRARGRRTHVSDLIVRPAWRFGRDYLLMGGWRDGTAGLITAGVSAFSVFLKYACLLTNPSA